MSHLFRCGLLGIFLNCAPSLSAHDFWVQPARFQLDPASSLPILLQVGDDFGGGDLFPRDRFHMKRFVVWGLAGEVHVDAPVGRLSRLASRRQGKAPAAGYLQLNRRGLYVIGYESQPTPAVLEVKLFRRYLDKEGLQDLDLHAVRQNGKEASVVELYSRCAKSLVQVGSPAGGAKDRQLGFPLELLAERNPYQLVPGTDLPVRIVYRARPLAGGMITALHQRGQQAPLRVESDSQGRAIFQPGVVGAWMIRAIHLVSADWDEADFQSYWASLTFELPTNEDRR